MNSQILLQRCLLSPYLSFSIITFRLYDVCTISIHFERSSSWVVQNCHDDLEAMGVLHLFSSVCWGLVQAKVSYGKSRTCQVRKHLGCPRLNSWNFLGEWVWESMQLFDAFRASPKWGDVFVRKSVAESVFAFQNSGLQVLSGRVLAIAIGTSILRNEPEMCQRKGSPVQTYMIWIWRSKRSPHTWRCSLERLPQPLSHTAMVWISFFLEPAEASASTQDKSILVLQRSGKVTEVAHATPLYDYVCNLFGHVVTTCRPLFYHVLSNIWYLYCHAPCESILQLLCVQDTFAYQTNWIRKPTAWYIVPGQASGGRFRGNVAVSQRKKPLALWWQVVEKTLEDIAEKQPVAELSFQWSRWTALSPTQWSHVSDHWSQKASASARHCHCTFLSKVKLALTNYGVP